MRLQNGNAQADWFCEVLNQHVSGMVVDPLIDIKYDGTILSNSIYWLWPSVGKGR